MEMSEKHGLKENASEAEAANRGGRKDFPEVTPASLLKKPSPLSSREWMHLPFLHNWHMLQSQHNFSIVPQTPGVHGRS